MSAHVLLNLLKELWKRVKSARLAFNNKIK